MPKLYKLILAISVLLSAVCFVHDYLYDPLPTPYTVTGMIVEIIMAGTLYTGIFFGIIPGTYAGIRKILGKA